MTKLFRGEKLRNEIAEAIVRLSSRIPLYSIRLEDIREAINSKYNFDHRNGYRNGSILFALNRGMEDLLSEMDPIIATQIKNLDYYLLRGKSKKVVKERVGRWRRTTLIIKYLAFEYVFKKLSPMFEVHKLNIHPALKLKILAGYFFSFAFSDTKFAGEMGEGMREIFIVEFTLPIGTKMEPSNQEVGWVEPIYPKLVNFFKSLDNLVIELQMLNILKNTMKPQAIRQSFFGALMGLALGKILAQRSNSVSGEVKEVYSADYSQKHALDSILQILLGFCVDQEAQEKFKSEWSH